MDTTASESSVAEIPLSMCPSVHQSDCQTARLGLILDGIREGRWREKVEALRAINDNAQRNEAKRNLPCVLWSGVFEKRKSGSLKNYSGLICADLDKLNEHLEEIRGKLIEDPHVVTCFVSPSGTGLKVVFRVRTEASQHRYAFDSVKSHVRRVCGVAIDEACKDLARACFVSHDVRAFVNLEAKSLPVKLPKKSVPPILQPSIEDCSVRQRIAAELLGEISWDSNSMGFCRCPGIDRHTTPDGDKDCRVTLDRVPSIHCFHNSCRPVIDAMKDKLRSQIGQAEGSGRSRQTDRQPRSFGGQPMTFEEYEPWTEAVPTGELLDEIRRQLNRHCVLPTHGDVVVSLWILFTHVFDLFDIAPMLRVYSPTKRCGKTTMVEFVQKLVNRPLPMSNGSPPSMFRAIEKLRPTLLIDEADTFFARNSELVGIMNSGHSKRSAFVLRVVGEGTNYEPVKFSTWAPKLIAGIGRMTGTIEDRSIGLSLTRKPASVRLSRVRRFDSTELCCKLARWAKDNQDVFANDDTDFDKLPNDRANDNWSPLVAIAKSAGTEWVQRAERAAFALNGEHESDDSHGTQLLADLRKMFRERSRDRWTSADIVRHLHSLEDRPWAEFGRKEIPITQTQLARLLKPFGIEPRNMKAESKVLRGYFVDDFARAFNSYLTDHPQSERHPATEPENTEVNGDLPSATASEGSGLENGSSAHEIGHGSMVAAGIDEKPETDETIYV